MKKIDSSSYKFLQVTCHRNRSYNFWTN